MDKRKKWNPEELAQLKVLRDEGKSFGEIANIMGVSKNATLAAYHQKVAKTQFPSNLKKYGLDETARFKPSLPMVPGLTASEKYQLVRVEYERLG